MLLLSHGCRVTVWKGNLHNLCLLKGSGLFSTVAPSAWALRTPLCFSLHTFSTRELITSHLYSDISQTSVSSSKLPTELHTPQYIHLISHRQENYTSSENYKLPPHSCFSPFVYYLGERQQRLPCEAVLTWSILKNDWLFLKCKTHKKKKIFNDSLLLQYTCIPDSLDSFSSPFTATIASIVFFA